jgi:hypothetical protein
MALILKGDNVGGCEKHLGGWRSDCADCKSNTEHIRSEQKQDEDIDFGGMNGVCCK